MPVLDEKVKGKIFKAFDDLNYGDTIVVAEFAKRDPDSFLTYAKEYINQGGGLEISNDYKVLRKILGIRDFKSLLDVIPKKINNTKKSK